MHQTGWTALVADLLIDPPRHSRRLIFPTGDTDDPQPAPHPNAVDATTASPA